MNSLLQCLFYIPELREYFVKEKESGNFDEEDKSVCYALSEEMYSMKNGKSKFIRPEKFKKVMGSKNILFSEKKAADAKDLFFHIIDCLLTEINSDNTTNLDEDEPEKDISELDENDLFKEHEKDIDRNIINKLFLGYYETLYYCPKDNTNITYSFQTESFILFELEKIKKCTGEKDISIELCFNYYSRIHKNSSFFCNKCSKIEENISKDRIYRPPEILVIILDRGHGKTFVGKVIYDKYLDLKNIIYEKDYDYYSLYKLICISSHFGESSSSGHYIATSLTNNDDTYYCFNDKKVEIINEK